MAAAESSVMSTCDPAGARSHANTRSATRISWSARGRRVPGRTDAATGLRIIDAIVVHPAQDPQEGAFHLLHLLQRQRGFIELAGVDLGAHDVIDRLFDLLGRQILEDAQRRFDRVAVLGIGVATGAGLGPGEDEAAGLWECPAVAFVRLAGPLAASRGAVCSG